MQAQSEPPVSNRLAANASPKDGAVALAVSRQVDGKHVIDEHFGRCDGFLLFSDQTDPGGQWLENTGREAAHGAGTGASRLLLSHNVVSVVGPRFGPKAEAALIAGGISCYLAKAGTSFGQALEAFRQGSLELVRG